MISKWNKKMLAIYWKQMDQVIKRIKSKEES